MNKSLKTTQQSAKGWSITKWKNVWFLISGGTFVAALIVWATFGLTVGIDFTGGSLMQVSYANVAESEDVGTGADAVQKIVEKTTAAGIENALVQPVGDDAFIIKTRFLSDDERQVLLGSLGNGVVEESFESIGPTVGAELRQKSFYAMSLVVIGILIYIAFVFRRVSKGPVPSWAFGVSAIIALAHDIVITIGVYVLLGQWFNAEVNLMFITALLTILGFSVNDSIVVFDRIREVLRRSKTTSFAEAIDESVRNTMMRSLNTATTTAIVLLALLLFGGESIRFFILVLLLGISIGTYSSIFVASPLLLVWQRILRR